MPDFPFHFQDTETTYCGPACLMMMLESQMERLNLQPITLMQQPQLFSLVRSKCGSRFAQSGCGYFYSSPDAIAAVASEQLDALDPLGTLGLSYSVFPDPALADPAQDEYTAAIRDSLDAAKAPVFALMRSGRHWILVYGWSGNPGERFYNVRWPSWRGSSLNAGQFHDAVCTICGESSDAAVSEADLLKDLLPVLNVKAGEWAGQTILVTPRVNSAALAPPIPPAQPAVEPVPDQPPQPAEPPVQPIPDQPTQPTQPAQPMEATNESGEQPEASAEAMSREAAPKTEAQTSIQKTFEGLTAKAAKPLPLEEVRKLMLSRLPKFIELFENHSDRLANQPDIGVPVFVEHLDDPAESYFLVPVFPRTKTREPNSTAEIRPFLLAQISATTGRLQRVEAATTKGADFGGDYSRPFWVYVILAAEFVMEKLASSTERAGSAPLQSSNKLVWKPCRQSTSPFQPFQELTDGQRKLWMDVFGTIHTQLDTETLEGG